MSKISETMNSYELEQALACKQMEVEDLRRQLAEQAEAIDLQLHTNRRIAELEEKVAKWVEEAGKKLDGYRAMGAKCAELEAERDQLRQQLATANSAYKIVQNDCWNLTEKVIPNLRQKLAASQQALSKVCEEWSGIDGMPQPEDEVGWYLFQLVEKMRDAAMEGIK